MIAIVDDDRLMAKCLKQEVQRTLPREAVKLCADGVALMTLLEEELPRLIILDLLLAGANGLTILQELASYTDTARIPVIMVSTLNLTGYDLSEYGVVRIFDKGKMRPEELRTAVMEVLGDEDEK